MENRRREFDKQNYIITAIRDLALFSLSFNGLISGVTLADLM